MLNRFSDWIHGVNCKRGLAQDLVSDVLTLLIIPLFPVFILLRLLTENQHAD